MRSPLDRYDISDRRKKAFERKEGEDPHQWIARQLAMAKPFEVAWLMMLREDEDQRRAMETMQQAKTVFWTRLAVVFAALSLPVSVIAALIANS